MSEDAASGGSVGGASSGGSSASSPTPGSGSGPASSSPGSGSGSDSGSGFDFMSEVFDSSTPSSKGGDAGASPVQPSAAPATTPPSTQPPAPAQAPGSEAAKPPVQPGAEPSVQQGSQAQQQPDSSPRFDPADPISLARALAEPETYQAAIEHLAATQFRLEPKELEGLEMDLAGTVPRLLAKATVFAQTQFLTQLSRIVPLMIQRQQAVHQRHNSNLDKFYSSWPSLDKAKHSQAVNELAVRYRQMFPEAPTDQMIAHIGPMVLAQLGLPIVPMAQLGQARAKANGGAPAAPAARPAGFVPAAPGTVAQMTTVPEDPWGYMGLQE